MHKQARKQPHGSPRPASSCAREFLKSKSLTTHKGFCLNFLWTELKGGGKTYRKAKPREDGPSETILETLRKWFLRRSPEGNSGDL